MKQRRRKIKIKKSGGSQGFKTRGHPQTFNKEYSLLHCFMKAWSGKSETITLERREGGVAIEDGQKKHLSFDGKTGIGRT